MAIKWTPVDVRLPDDEQWAYFVAGHEWFGIAWWDGYRWAKGYVGEFPSDCGGLCDAEYLNVEVMYWAEMPSDYPIYGTRMGECEKQS